MEQKINNNNKLLFEVQHGYLKAIKSLVELKCVDVNYSDYYGWSALHYAADLGYSEKVEYLVLKGANIDAIDKKGQTPLFKSVMWGNVGTAKTLIRLGAKTDIFDRNGSNIIDFALNNYHRDLIHFIMELGLYISDDQYKKLFLNSAKCNDLETIKTLVELTNVDINYVEDFWSALHNAAEEGNIKIVEHLLLKGANVNVIDNRQKITPLFKAVENGNVEIAKTLMRHGAKIDSVDSDGENLIDYALKNVKFELIQFVLELGFDIDRYDRFGYTPLIRVIREYSEEAEEAAKFLLKRGANYRKYSLDNGESPLHFAIRSFCRPDIQFVGSIAYWGLASDPIRETSTIKLLLEHVERNEGEEGMLNYLNYNGNSAGHTALHLACIRKIFSAAKFLLHCGVNLDISDKSGKVPYDYVSSGGDVEQIKSVFDEMKQRAIPDHK